MRIAPIRPAPAIAMYGQCPWRLAGYGLLLGVAVLAALTFRDYGNGFDAQVQDVCGKDIIHWFESGGADSTALRFRDLYFYGGWFDTLAALIAAISPFAHWATRPIPIYRPPTNGIRPISTSPRLAAIPINGCKAR
jgi:hypothetical protein